MRTESVLNIRNGLTNVEKEIMFREYHQHPRMNRRHVIFHFSQVASLIKSVNFFLNHFIEAQWTYKAVHF